MASEAGISRSVVAPVMRALAELGYRAPEKRASKPVVEGSAADALIDDAARALKDDAIGLSLAKRIPIGTLGDVDYALCTSKTLGDGLVRVAKYYGLVTERVTLSLALSRSAATLVYDRGRAATYSPHWVDFATAIIAERIRQTVGRSVAFSEVAFVHDAPRSTKAHDSFFGVKVRFRAPQDSISFAPALLDAPLVTASATLAELLEARMSAVAKGDAYLTRVRTAVGELVDGGETLLPATAARLGTSTRTLQRELGQRGVSHQSIVDEVRRERAKSLLERGTPIAEVSRRLGFSEPSAFFRAFRRWTGTSPRRA